MDRGLDQEVAGHEKRFSPARECASIASESAQQLRSEGKSMSAAIPSSYEHLSAARPRGARWFSSWLRQQREVFGLERRQAAWATRSSPRPISVTLLADLEIGDRLPSLSTLPALALIVRRPAWTLAERIRLAPRVEPEYLLWQPGRERSQLSAHAQELLRQGRAAAAFVRADAATRADSCAAALITAEALIELGFTALATHTAGAAMSHAESVTERRRAIELLARAASVEGNKSLAQVWSEAVERSSG
jgi:hypothetical protein